MEKQSYFKHLARSRPALFISISFFLVVLFYTLLLALPFSTQTGEAPSFAKAFFTISSAISGTGLILEPTGLYWSDFGKVIILLTMQTGGLGVMTLAGMLAMTVSKHLGLVTKILTANDLQSSKYGELGSLIRLIVITMFSIEFIVCLMLLPRFLELKESVLDAIWHSVFFAVSGFNNAGFDLSQEGFSSFASHWGVAIPMIIALEMGAIGFPVIHNVVMCIKKWSFKQLSLHSKITIAVTTVMNVIIVIWFFLTEWSNTAIFTPDVMNNTSEHAAGITFQAFTTRASGFGVVSPSLLTQPTLLLSQVWMFIGGGAASTCAGIKVTTLAVFIFAAIAEFRGRQNITAFKKRLPEGSLRVAVTVLLTGVIAVLMCTLFLDLQTEAPLGVVMFDVISAYSNCGLSLGLGPQLNDFGQMILSVLMVAGRLGTMTVAAALMKRDKTSYIVYPEESVIIG